MALHKSFIHSSVVLYQVCRDPRFDDLSGSYNEAYFTQAYGFLSDVKEREKQVGILALINQAHIIFLKKVKPSKDTSKYSFDDYFKMAEF